MTKLYGVLVAWHYSEAGGLGDYKSIRTDYNQAEKDVEVIKKHYRSEERNWGYPDRIEIHTIEPTELSLK